MVFNPCCCGCSLKLGTQIIAAIRMFFGGLDILLAIPAYIYGYVELYTAILMCVMGLVVFFISAVLYQGAIEKNVQKCMNWLLVNIGIFLGRLIVQILVLITKNVSQGVLIGSAFGFLWDLYSMLVVFCFITELQRVNDDSRRDSEQQDRY